MELLDFISNNNESTVNMSHYDVTREIRQERRVRDVVPDLPKFENTKNILERAQNRSTRSSLYPY